MLPRSGIPANAIKVIASHLNSPLTNQRQEDRDPGLELDRAEDSPARNLAWCPDWPRSLFLSDKGAGVRGFFTSPWLKQFRDQAGPAGLMGSAYAATIVPVEVLVKKNVVTKVRVGGQFGRSEEHTSE